MNTKVTTLIVIFLLLAVLLVGMQVGDLATAAIDTAASRPESVSAAIAASRTAAPGESGSFPWWLIAGGLLTAATFLFWRGGELLRQWRLTRRPVQHRPSVGRGYLPEIGRVPTVPMLPDGEEEII